MSCSLTRKRTIVSCAIAATVSIVAMYTLYPILPSEIDMINCLFLGVSLFLRLHEMFFAIAYEGFTRLEKYYTSEMQKDDTSAWINQAFFFLVCFAVAFALVHECHFEKKKQDKNVQQKQ